jgi:hypothetical protein
MPGDLRLHREGIRDCFATKMRDPSEQTCDYLQEMLTMEKDRHLAGISRAVQGGYGQALQHFKGQSPWSGQAVFKQIQREIRRRSDLAAGSCLLLDESADEIGAVIGLPGRNRVERSGL